MPDGAGEAVEHRVVAVRNLPAEDERAWSDLGARALEPNPFFEPDFVVPAALHQANGAQIRLLIVEDDGRFVACLPFLFTNRWKLPYPLVSSNVRRMHSLGTPLIDRTSGVSAAVALLSGLAEQRRLHRGRVLFLCALAADGPVAKLVRAAAEQLRFPLRTYDSYERGFLRRRPDGNYDALHGSKSMYNLRRQRRLLSKHFGGAEVRIVDRSNDLSAVDDYIELEASGYKARTGVAMTTAPGEPEYFREMCKRHLGAERLKLLALEVADTTIAMVVWVEAGDGIFLHKISYDERYARYGPGVLAQTMAIPHFHDCTKAEWIDTCTSKDNAILLRLYPDRRVIESFFVVLGRNVVDRAVVSLFLMARPAHRRIYHWLHPDHVPVGSGHP